ncbi:MAG: peptide chain release factor 2 [Bdellovibrionota bacterium]
MVDPKAELSELRERLSSASSRLLPLRGHLDIAKAKKSFEEIEGKMSAPGFWDDPEAARKIVAERKRLVELLDPWEKTSSELNESKEFADLLAEAMDTGMLGELKAKVSAVEEGVRSLEFKKMLSGQNDAADAIVALNAGSGGTEAQDWAEMLLRMYLRYCERREWETEILELSEGEQAGIKSATFTVKGPYSYGYLKAESGVHRLVRISPYDANKRRHTSFASVFVYPDVQGDIEIEIKEEDLRIDTYRAGGKGGQKVNKTDSAVRMTHIPSGIVVACQNERSQHQNRAMAMKLLKAKLYDLETKKREAERDAIEASKKDIAWGSQIRSYVLQPYRMVKDHRTGVKIGDTDKVLDGDLQEFIESFLLGVRKGDTGPEDEEE